LLPKLINTIIITIQWIFSLLAGVYLIVPGYTFEKEAYYGNDYYNPYSEWKNKPLTEIHFKGITISDEENNNELFLSPLNFAAPVYALDTLSHKQMGKFFMGYSVHDIQYLISDFRKKQPDPVILLKPNKLPPENYTAFNGINLIQLSNSLDEAYWDTLLNYGRPVFAIANAESGYSGNLAAASTPTAEGVLTAIKNGQNLMVFSNQNLADTGVSKIPVVRKIEWHQNTVHIDLSEPAEISLITSGFRLDTLSQSLHLKLIDQDWMRFKVAFKEAEITYISNPIFRFEGDFNEPHTIKGNNLRSIFYNLAWLIGIVLINLMVFKFRRTCIIKKVDQQ